MKLNMYIKEPMAAALEEYMGEGRPDRLAKLFSSRSKLLEYLLAEFLKKSMVGSLSKPLIDSCISVDDVFRIFVNWQRAVRGVEGYKARKRDNLIIWITTPGE